MAGGGAPRLLLREQGELDAVAARLRKGRRVVVFCVCPGALRPAALERLRAEGGVEIPDPVSPASPDEALATLTALQDQPAGVVASLALDAKAVDVLRTINWHREKLRRGGSSLLWLEDVEGLSALRSWAPDAYAFRDGLVILAGEPSMDGPPSAKDNTAIALGKLRLRRARTLKEKVEAALALAGMEHERGALSVLGHAAWEAWNSTDPELDEPSKIDRAEYALILALAFRETGQLAQGWRWMKHAMAEFESRPLRFEPERRQLELLREELFDPEDPLGAIGIHEIARIGVGASGISLSVLEADRVRKLGWIREAGALLEGARAGAQRSVLERAIIAEAQARISLGAGNLTAAVEQGHAARALRSQAGSSEVRATMLLATCLHDKGELRLARRLLEDILGRGAQAPLFQQVAARMLAGVLLDEGRVGEALAELQTLALDAANRTQDGHLYQACVSLVAAVERASDAGRLSEGDLEQALTTVAIAEDVALSIAPRAPPWYVVLFPALRADILALQPEHIDEVRRIRYGAIDHACDLWPYAIPRHLRDLIRHLIHAGRSLDAWDLCLDVELEDTFEAYVHHLATFRAFHIVVMARHDVEPSIVDASLSRLCATFDASGSRRLAAETLLDLAIALPPETSSPDPLSLLDEAHALFVDMPMPAQEARCLEAMGDILAARAQPVEARNRYLLARGIYEQYGLGLRLPVLTEKLARLP